MTPQEQQILNEFLNRVAASPAPARDPDADAMIRKSPLASRSDAMYILTQLALIQDISLRHAEQQIQELQQRVNTQPASATTSFLGGPWGQTTNTSQTQQAQPRYAPATTAPAAPGFLHSALTTASGVIAGEMAFSALHSLFGGGGFGGGMAGTGGGFFGGAPRSETVINNYYGDSSNADNSNDDSTDYTSDDSDSGDYSDNSSDYTA